MPKLVARQAALGFDLAATDRPHPFARILFNCAVIVAGCVERSRQRRALAALDERLLRDVGLSRQQARLETAKPFWMR